MRPDYFHKIKFVSMNAKIIEENSELSFSVVCLFAERCCFIYAMRCRNIWKRKMIMEIGVVCRYCVCISAVVTVLIKRGVVGAGVIVRMVMNTHGTRSVWHKYTRYTFYLPALARIYAV